MKKVIGLLILVGAAAGANAQVVIDGDVTLVPGVGSITSGGGTGDPSGWTYWTFSAAAGDVIDWEVNRLVGEMDPVASVVEGNLAGAAFAGTIFDNPLMGLTSVSFSDDTDPPFIPGPWGDPHASFVAPSTGVYTIAVATYLGGSIPPDGYVHEVIVRGSSVPAPAAAGLFGLVGLAAARRRRA